ncbi:MAG TPA: hypothetical protein VED01_04975 [Burkholderiales bacterium]|nr:hypothetical protein [Burkholderiales bacterium]
MLGRLVKRLLRGGTPAEPALDDRHAYLEYGLDCTARGDWKKALPPLECAVARAPDSIAARLALARALLAAGKALRARGHAEAAARIDGAQPAVRALVADVEAALAPHAAATLPGRSSGESIRMALTLPHILGSSAEIAVVREQLSRELDRLKRSALSVADPANAVGLTAFYLAYHGENDRTFQERIANIHLAACPSLAFVAPHCTRAQAPRERLRIGFVSDYFYDHSIGRVTAGLIEQLDRTRFSVYVFGFREPFDTFSRAIARAADEAIVLPRDLVAARQAIARYELDVLFYPDVGMEPLTYFMTFARLAPVQCTTWGHPVTTGVPAMDWFLSTEYFEAADAAEHYSERLFTLRDAALPGYYRRPDIPPAASPAQAGFDPARHTYFCPQSLFKLHPDFDAILAEILRRDPEGDIVLVYNERADVFTRPVLEARLARSAADVSERIVFVPRAPSRDGYLQRLMCAHVVLDTPRYCGGNTSLEAISCGALVVTLPSEFNRGRQTYGFFRKIGFMDTVASDAADYVAKAVRIATDAQHRAQLARLQASRVSALYEDAGAIRQIERFFETVAAAPRAHADRAS